ncbi:hypothetical protein U1Q18_036238 [Sarracenia purpurea var. burkii]
MRQGSGSAVFDVVCGGRVWLQTLKEEITGGELVCNVTGEEEGGFCRRLQVAGVIKTPNRDEFRKGLGQYHLGLRRNSRPATNQAQQIRIPEAIREIWTWKKIWAIIRCGLSQKEWISIDLVQS